MRDITREEAVCLFRRQWSDMQMAHGDCPDYETRVEYKEKWCKTHGFSFVDSDCFLCEWVRQNSRTCFYCPIDWGNIAPACVDGKTDYRRSPISEILALPERKVE